MRESILSVTELNGFVRSRLENDPALMHVAVQGEVSGYKMYPGSGYHYFSLKDKKCVVSCVITRNNARRLRFLPQESMSVVLMGFVTLYEPQGKYQLSVTDVLPVGAGDLEAEFERLRAKLEAEGLFDPMYKKPLPRYPERVAVVTSESGAVIHDIIRTLGKRWPAAKILLLPVLVQGEGAPAEIVRAIRYANEHRVADVMIVGRGGGSREDLWAFNDEGVARAIFASEIPVISAVGHRPDVTIADYVADVTAHTPTDAAEVAGPDAADIRQSLRQNDIRLRQAAENRLELLSRRLRDLAERPVMADPALYFSNKRQTLDWQTEKMCAAMERRTGEERRRFAGYAAKLDALSPLKVLSRGYAIAEKDGAPLRRTGETSLGERIDVILADGSLGCTVEEVRYNG